MGVKHSIFDFVFCSRCGCRLGNPLRLSLIPFVNRFGTLCNDCRDDGLKNFAVVK